MMNASCRILRPTARPSATQAMQLEHVERAEAEGRCRLVKMTARQEATIAGQAAVSMWSCRLVLSGELREAIREGWRIEARIDGEELWHEYRVTRVAVHHHVFLTLERVN